MPRVFDHDGGRSHQVLHAPMLWLGHNLRNGLLLARHGDLKCSPLLVSLGDAFLRPSYKQRFFTEHIRESLGMEGPVMVDSGGYALLSRPSLRWSLREIARIYATLPAEILVSLDHPTLLGDDPETQARLRRKTLRNLEQLRNVVPPTRLMPVVHGHCVEELERSCQGIKRLCPDSQLIGVGGMVPFLCSGGSIPGFRFRRKDGTIGDRGDWIADALEIVRNAFPQALLHVFGVGSATTGIGVLALGADSADSLSWRRVANYGAILLPGRSERFPLFRDGRVASRPVIGEADLPLLMACRCPACLTAPTGHARLANLAKCYKHRAVHNAWTVLAEVEAFRAAVQAGQLSEFLTSRLGRTHRLYKPVMQRLARLAM